MLDLIEKHEKLIQVLQENKPVVLTRNGKWFIENRFIQKLKEWLGLSSLKAKKNIHIFQKQLIKLEKEPILFGSFEQKLKCHALLKIGAALLGAYKAHIEIEEGHSLEQKIVALKYRMEGINGGLDPIKGLRDHLEELKRIALEWKKDQALIIEKNLTVNDHEELRKVACYAEFVSLILRSKPLQDDLFRWIIQDQNGCSAFIQFPSLVKRLVECNLNGRLACHGTSLLKIVKEPVSHAMARKIVTLPFEGREINILNEEIHISFRGNLSMALKDVFEVFKNKELRVGNLEFMKEGIINWNIHHLGYWDNSRKEYIKIDIEKDKWWQQLPLFEILTVEQARMRYGRKLNGVNWSAAATATRGIPSLSYEKTHAFLELAIPIEGKGYAVYDFGKLAYCYPGSIWELLDMFCRNVHATVAYPDDNVYYSHRQHALHSFILSAQEGEFLMGLIKEDIRKARKYNFVYQIESENCAKWVQTKLEATLGGNRVPNLYRMQLLDTEPDGPIATIFRMIKKLPESWQVPVLTLFHLPLGAAKKTWIEENGLKVSKSLTTHPFWRSGEIYLPAFMHDQLLKGSLKCTNGMEIPCFSLGLLADKHKWGFVKPVFRIVRKHAFLKYQKSKAQSNLHSAQKPNQHRSEKDSLPYALMLKPSLIRLE